MTTVSAGATGSFTFTASSNTVSVELGSAERAHVTVLSSAGALKYRDNISVSRNIGPFSVGDVMTLTAIGGSVDYTTADSSQDSAALTYNPTTSTITSPAAIAALQAVPGLGGGANAAPVDVTADAALTADDAGQTFVNNTGASKTLTLVTGLGQIVLVHGAQPLVAAAGAVTLTGDTTTSVSKPRIVVTEVSAGVYQGVGTVTGTPAPGTVSASRNVSASDNDTTSVFTGAYTLTIPLGLAGYNGSTHQPPASGLATITGAAGVTINGTLAGSVTRGLVSNRLFVITRIAENVFEVSGV